MKAILRSNRNRFMTRFLSSHLLILLVPMLVFAAGFRQTSNIVKNDVLEANLASLEQSKTMIDQSLKEIANLVAGISTDPGFQWLLDREGPLDLTDYARLYENTKGARAMYNLSSAAVLRYYVIYPRCGVVLSPAGVYQLENFYGYAFSAADMTAEQWREEYFRDDGRAVFSPRAPW